MPKSKNWPLILGWISLLALYLTSRLFYLMRLPMFIDEAIHLLWALQVVAVGPFSNSIDISRAFPLWIISLALPYTSNLLLAARLVAVMFGVFGLLGSYLLGYQLFDHRTGFIAALLYLVTPYTFFHDRIALFDGLLATLAIYILLFSIQVIWKPNWRFGFILGIVMALAPLTKFYGLILWLLPLIVIGGSGRPFRSLPWRGLVLAYGIASMSLIPIVLYFTIQENQVTGRIWSEASGTTLGAAWLLSARNIFLYLVQNLSPLIFIVVLLGIIIAVRRYERSELILVGGSALTIGIFLFLSRPDFLFPRYILPAVPFLLLIAARTFTLGMDKFSISRWQPKTISQSVFIGSLLIIVLPAFWFDYWLMIDPAQAPLVELDQWQYVKSWPAGYGITETATYLRNQLLSSDKIIVAYDTYTYRPSSTLATILQVYLYDQRSRITYREIDFSTKDINYLTQQLAVANSLPVFIVLHCPLRETTNLDSWPYTQLVAYFSRPAGFTGIFVYKASIELGLTSSNQSLARQCAKQLLSPH